jgi:hypothetical protein
MKTLAIREKKAQAAAAMMAAMVTRLLVTKKTLIRLILRSRNFRNIRPFEAIRVHLYIHGICNFCLNKFFCKFYPAQVLRARPAQDVTPLRIHRDKMFVSSEAWHLFKKVHPEQDFSDFWLETSLKFFMGCFDLSSFFLLCKKEGSTSANLSSAKLPKTEPLSPITDGLDFAYASDVAEDDSCEPGHVVELSF